MRSHLWLVAASGRLASANWIFGQQPDGGGGAVILPRETKASAHGGANGWTPRPTEAPFVHDGANAFELARRRDEWIKLKRQRSSSSSNTWLNENTCGWIAGPSSAPFICESSSTCATSAGVVGCNPLGTEPGSFFTVCLNYQAYQEGACKTTNTDTKTGCCMTSSVGACITYIWPGKSPKSMFLCHTEQRIITMLDEPQFVIDDRTRTTSTTSTSTRSSTSATAPAQTDSPPPPGSNEGGGNNTGVIVGGVVGGVAGVALIAGAIAFVVIRRRNKNSNVGSGVAYSAVAPGDTSYPGAGAGSTPIPPAGYVPSSVSPQMSNAGYFSPNSVGNSATPAVPSVYTAHHSYYDPAKPPEHPQQQQTAGYAPYPGGVQPYPGPYPGQTVSELDSASVAAGQHSNPVEMPAGLPAQR